MWRKGKSYTLLVEMKTGRYTLKTNIQGPQNIKIELPHDPATPPLGINAKKMKSLSQREICTPMFIASFLVLAKAWEQSQVMNR